MSYNLISYLPSRYRSILEMQESLKGQSNVVNLVGKHLTDFVNNQFVVTSDEYGVSLRESLLGIIADPITETLEFRKARLLNRLQSNPPYTEKFLRQRLDAIIGEGLYKLTVNGSDFEIILDSSAENQYWSEEIYITMLRIKPSNMVYINRPLVTAKVVISEGISYGTTVFNYKLGTWLLGQKPFTEFADKGVIKLPTTSSITNSLKEDTASIVSGIPTKVLINDLVEITEVNSSASGKVAEISYTVPTSIGVNEITNLKLLGVDDEVKTNSNVYIPLNDDLHIRHNITVEEGV